MASPYWASRSHLLDKRLTVGLLWTSDNPGAETHLTTLNTHKQQTSVPTAGFEPTMPAGELRTNALDHAATGNDVCNNTDTFYGVNFFTAS